MNKILLAFSAVLAGCVSFPKVVESNYIGACLELNVHLSLLETRKDLYKSNRFISKRRTYGKYSNYLGVLEQGSKVEIDRVLAAADGSWGKFLRVQVKVLDGEFSGVIADVPVHAPYHPSGKWTKNFTLDPNALEFNEEIVVPCD